MDADEESAPATTHPEGAPCLLYLHPHSVCPHCHNRHDHESYRYQRQEAAYRQSLEAVKRQEASRSRIEARVKALAGTSRSSAEIHSPPEEEGSTIRSTAKSRRRARKKERSRRKASAETTPSQPSAEIHRPSEEQASTMANVDIGVFHEEDRLPDWMSQLFEKLDLEANKDEDSTGKVSQGETHSLLEGGISSESHSFSEKNLTMLEVNKDDIYSTGKVAHGEIHLLEGGISSETHRSTKKKDSTTDKLYFGGLYDDDKFLDWMINICFPPEVDQEEECPTDDVPDEFNGLIDKSNDYCKSMKKDSYRKTIENGIKWMSEECLLAFTKSVENFNSEGIEHRFGELHSQCFSIQAYDKNFHHFNFTIEEKRGSSDIWTSKLYFAEVKQFCGLKSYLCRPLEPNECGQCHGCKNQDMYELKHPNTGGYEEGDADICWPFMDDLEYDSNSGDDYDHSS